MLSWLLDRIPHPVGDLHAHIRAVEERTKEAIMAVGPETQAALDELGAKISAEADQRAAELIDTLSADADTAAAIRDKFAAVAAIVPDAVTDPEAPVETPAGPVDETVTTEEPTA